VTGRHKAKCDELPTHKVDTWQNFAEAGWLIENVSIKGQAFVCLQQKNVFPFLLHFVLQTFSRSWLKMIYST